jgi:hypothetical protein
MIEKLTDLRTWEKISLKTLALYKKILGDPRN